MDYRNPWAPTFTIPLPFVNHIASRRQRANVGRRHLVRSPRIAIRFGHARSPRLRTGITRWQGFGRPDRDPPRPGTRRPGRSQVIRPGSISRPDPSPDHLDLPVCGSGARPTVPPVRRSRDHPSDTAGRTGFSAPPQRPPDLTLTSGTGRSGPRNSRKTRTISLIVNTSCTLRGSSCEPRIMRLEEYLYPWRSRKEAEIWRGPLVASRTSPCRRTPTHACPCPGRIPDCLRRSSGVANGTSDLQVPRRHRGQRCRPFRVRPSRTATHERGPRRRWKAAYDYES